MPQSNNNIQILAQELRERVDQRLAQLIGSTDANHNLSPALQYALLASGKRVRPLICLMSATCLGGRLEDAIDPACAIEMIHTASLIVDDLPCMDDAEMRRGKLACHRRFGEATTVLVALELMSLAYRVMSEAPNLTNARQVQLVQLLARAVGVEGLIGGQERDLAAENDKDPHAADTGQVMDIHELKTGALFIAAAESGAIVAGLEGDRLIPIRDFASRVGLAYQTLDDLLDVQGTPNSTGKDVGKDIDKPTLVGALGPEAAGEYADNMIAAAMAALQPLGENMRPLERFLQSALGRSAVSRHALN